MAKLTAREAALLRMAMHDEMAPLKKDALNMDPNVGAEYPKMLYRKTDVEDIFVNTTKDDGSPRETTVLNRFNGYLCDVYVAQDADEAEALSADGWEITPHAAYGEGDGLRKQVTAKDARIAELEAMLAAREDGEQIKRGPGRPPKSLTSESEGATA